MFAPGFCVLERRTLRETGSDCQVNTNFSDAPLKRLDLNILKAVIGHLNRPSVHLKLATKQLNPATYLTLDSQAVALRIHACF